MSKLTTDLSRVSSILNHDRAETTWIARAVLVDGVPTIERIARIVLVWPRDGAGRLRACVTDWGKRNAHGEPAQYVAHVTGWGYDKRSAVLSDCTVGGVELGDHCDGTGRPLLRDLARAQGWEIFGGAA